MRLMEDDLRIPIEEAVSIHLKKTWRISASKDMAEFACHPCAILSNQEYGVFVKYGEGPSASEQFEVETARLKFLSEVAGVRTPEPIGVIKTENGALFVLEGLGEISKQRPQWRQIAKILAQIHRIRSTAFGFESDGFWGPFRISNELSHDWIDFYTNRRLLPFFRVAVESGNMPADVSSAVENIIKRFSELCGSLVAPTLLHGDSQQNNFLCTDENTYVIDPAVYYGHPEIDLATIDSWQPVPNDFDFYKEEMPIDPGFPKRRNLWLIANFLGAVAAPEGKDYLPRLKALITQYL